MVRPWHHACPFQPDREATFQACIQLSRLQDEHPPLPDKISPLMEDFLLLCFQKVRAAL